MLHTVKTWDDHSLNSSAYRAVLLNPHGTPGASPVFLTETNADSVDAGVYTVDTQTLVLAIEIRDYADRHGLISQLKGWFKRGGRADLVVTFSDDGIDYQKNCRVVNLVQEPGYPLRYLATLESGVSAWRAVDPDTDTWALTGAGGTNVIDVGGGDETRLILELTATAAPASGYFKQNLYRFVNVPGIDFGYRPWCIVVDTATLVTAGKMRSDCRDLRIYNGELEIKRWIDTPNNANTKVWFNASMRAGFSLSLKTSVASSGDIALLQFVITPTNRALIAKMPDEGFVYHGTEWFYYKGKHVNRCYLYIKKRGVWNTVKQAHSAGDTFAYIQNPIRMVYNNASATDPASEDADYDAEKPMFNLNTSTNAKWVYDATTKFYDATTPRRTGQWALVSRKLGTVSKLYHIKGNVETDDPAMGIKVGSYQIGTLWRPDNVELSFILACPAGFDKVTATGRKYKNTTQWMPATGFDRSIDGVTWFALWAETTPTALATFQSWATHSSVSITNTAKYIRFSVVGIFPRTANAVALSEALTVTAEYVSANLPSGSFLGEVDNYQLDLTLSNDLSDDELTLNYPAIYNKPFLLDGENFVASFDDANAHRALTLDDPGRSVWLRLLPGSNTLTITATDLGTVSGNLSWYRRRL